MTNKQLTPEQRIFLEMITKLDIDTTCTFTNSFPNTTRISLEKGQYTPQAGANMNRLGEYYLKWKKQNTKYGKSVAGGTP